MTGYFCAKGALLPSPVSVSVYDVLLIRAHRRRKKKEQEKLFAGSCLAKNIDQGEMTSIQSK